MKRYWLFLVCFFGLIFTGFAQMKIGKLDLENDKQIHVLTLKDGNRYVGRISSMTGRKIVFELSGIDSETELTIRRKNINIIGSFMPSSDNSGVLRSPFDWVKKDFPNIELDTKLDAKNNSQQIRLIADGEAYFGRIKQVRKGGILVRINGQIEFFRFVSLSEISVIDWSYLDAKVEEGSSDFEFQVDTFQIDTLPKANLFDKAERGFEVGNASQKHALYTQVGNRFNGRITEIDGEKITFEMENGTVIYFEEAEIKKVEVYKLGHTRMKKANGVRYKKWKSFEGEDYILGQSRLFASQTGFGVKKGEVEYRGTQILINEMNYGVAKGFSIGGGLFPLIVENIFTFKADFHQSIGDFVHLSAGGQLFASIGGIGSEGSGEGAVLAYAAASFGSPARFINVAYNRWKDLDGFNKGDVVSVGGSFKISRRWRVFGDYFFTYDDNQRDPSFFFDRPTLESRAILIFGTSWFNKLNKIDFGFVLVPDTGVQEGDEAFALPIFGYVRRF